GEPAGLRERDLQAASRRLVEPSPEQRRELLALLAQHPATVPDLEEAGVAVRDRLPDGHREGEVARERAVRLPSAVGAHRRLVELVQLVAAGAQPLVEELQIRLHLLDVDRLAESTRGSRGLDRAERKSHTGQLRP